MVTCARTHLRMRACTLACACIHVNSRTNVHLHAHTHAHSRSRTCIHMHAHTCTHTCAQTHTHTHTHAQTRTHTHTHTGRLDKILYVPLPPPDGRASILKALVRNTPLAPGVDVDAIGMSTRCAWLSHHTVQSMRGWGCVCVWGGGCPCAHHAQPCATT